LLGAAALLRRRRRDEEAHERLVGQIEADIARGVALSRQLLLFARREKARTADVDLNDVLRSCGHLLGRLVRENVALRFELSPDALPARVDAGQIEQVLVNLTLNACDAITGGGSVTVRSGSAEPGLVWFEVADTGAGIDPESLPRIFEPFFTTKGRGKGTGLGLSVVHGIVEAHHARVAVESSPGGGAAFRVILPAAASAGDAAGREARPGAAGDPLPGSGKLLVVEDDLATLAALVGMLESLGYDVVGVTSGEEALRSPRDLRFDLLLTDYMMPGMNGAELATRLRERWPGLPVIVASGYVDDEAALLRIERDGMELLPKPFDSVALGATVARVLGGSRRAR
ncbi:MAG: response regulator, partial [Vicinamibacteria bacterium]